MQPKVIGHRGAAGHAPENTLPSFRKALELGADGVELDVRLTRDGRIVCFHDDRLNRVTPERGYVSEWEWQRLAEVPVLPGAFGGAFPQARIPLLEAVVSAVRVPTVVELKPEEDRPALLVQGVLDCLAEAPERFRWISFDASLLRRAAAAEASRLGVLTDARGLAHLFPLAREVRASALHVLHTLIDEALVRQAHDEGFLVNAWTVNRAEETRRLADLGVDEITTDYPDVVRSALE